jgi:hypothetical protein
MAKTMRLPLWCALFGVALKALLFLGWTVSENVILVRLLTVYDPISLWLAEEGVSVIFDGRRIWPGGPESLTFEVLLVLGFSLQCFVLGGLVQWLLQTLKHNRRTGASIERPRL